MARWGIKDTLVRYDLDASALDKEQLKQDDVHCSATWSGNMYADDEAVQKSKIN